MFTFCSVAPFTMQHTTFIVILLVYSILQRSSSHDLYDPNRCYPLGKCCTNFREVGGRCVECIGSFGKDCTARCPPNHYGRRCLSRCSCDIHERCDPAYGCCPKRDIKCKQIGIDALEDVFANNQRSTSDKPISSGQGNATETLTGIVILPVAISGLMLIAAIYIWMRIREKRSTTRAQPEEANMHEEPNASMGHVDEFCYDEIRKSQIITDENCDDAQGIIYSDHLCRHPTTSTGHCQICEMANHGTERASEDYSKLGEGYIYNILSLRSVPADVKVTCDATYVDENQYSPTIKIISEKEDACQDK